MSVHIFRSGLGLLLVLGCTGAWTHANVPRAMAQASSSDYQSLVEKGLREYELGNFSEAKAFFRQAHQLSPNARTLRGLGMTSYELRHYVEAIGYFQSALASKDRPLTAQMHAEVSQLLAQARSFVTRLQLTVTPAHAQLHLDSRELLRQRDGSILLDPGSHELVADAPEYETVTRSLRCDVGETLSLALTLHSVQSSAAEAPALAERSTTTSIAPYVVIAASAAVAVAGGALLALALKNKQTVEDLGQTAAGPRYADYQSKAASVRPLSAAGLVGLALGLAGIGVGLSWKLSLADHPTSTKLALSHDGLLFYGDF